MGSRASPTIVSISHCTPVAHTGTSTTRKNQRENPLAAMTASTIPRTNNPTTPTTPNPARTLHPIGGITTVLSPAMNTATWR